MSPHRPERVADRVRQILSRVLREELRDPRVGFVTITDVRMSPDLRHARVFVSILEDDPEPSFQALQRARPFLRHSLARNSGLRYTPELHLVVYESASRGFRVDAILDDVGDSADPQPGAGGNLEEESR